MFKLIFMSAVTYLEPEQFQVLSTIIVKTVPKVLWTLVFLATDQIIMSEAMWNQIFPPFVEVLVSSIASILASLVTLMELDSVVTCSTAVQIKAFPPTVEVLVPSIESMLASLLTLMELDSVATCSTAVSIQVSQLDAFNPFPVTD